MPDPVSDFRSKLIAALVESDDMRRAGRADRIQWLSEYQIHGGMIQGPMDTLAVLGEARDCFVEGHYIAALLLAVAFIEHTIADELIERDFAEYGISFTNSIKVARERDVFPGDMLSRADRLREIRNPFAHRKSPTHQHTFPNRFIQSRSHPRTILEQDAKDALALMYAFFNSTLKDG
jgi:hypothetical protein